MTMTPAPQQAPQQAQAPQGAEVFRRLLLAAMKLIYSNPKATQQFVFMVKTGQAQGIVQATKIVVGQITKSAQGLDPSILQKLMVPVATLIAELAVKAGVIKDDKAIMAQVTQLLQKAPQGQPPQPQAAPAPQAQPAQPQGGLINQAMGA